MSSNTVNDVRFFKTSKFDIVIISVILAGSIGFLLRLGYSRWHQSAEKKMCFIYQQTTLLEKTSMEKDRLITILNGRIQLQIKDGNVRVIQADCPEHLCMHMGWIQHSGQTIACVPNKVLIEIQSSGAPAYDAVSF